MNVTVNSAQAEIILREAIADVLQYNWVPHTALAQAISQVILGSHLTYRYILITGILAKATNKHCNPITLQAGSLLPGAYDARSLCHKVLVPVERELLGDRLGGSNEPFLNKPARYTELSNSNPARKGYDSDLLKITVHILSSLDSSSHAKDCLRECIYYTFDRQSRNLLDYLPAKTAGLQRFSLIKFAQQLISESHEGETCGLLAGITYDILGFSQNRSFDVKVHKANQAGSSSREVSDIDVYENNTLIHTIEVKDKLFTAADVEHAIGKAVTSGAKSLVFAVGPRGGLQGSTYYDLTVFWGRKGVDLYFVNVMEHFISILSTAADFDDISVVDLINRHAELSKIKDTTFRHLVRCIERLRVPAVPSA